MKWPAQSPAVLLIAASLTIATACGAATQARSARTPTGAAGGAATTQPSTSPSPLAPSPTPAPPAPSSRTAPPATPTPSAVPSSTPTGFVPAPSQAAITVYPVTSDVWDGVLHLRLGPDGALWFTQGGMAAGALGRITTDGVITTWPLPWPGADIEDFTFGDGFLWSIDYHDLDDSFIGKWTLSGTLVKEFPIPLYDFAITWGPDGALWFSGATASGMSLSNSFIGRMTVQGVVTQYAMPDGDDIAGDITTGPDGALWFSEDPGSSVGRVTTSGVITEYAVPGGENIGAIAYNQTIVVGRDGALWAIVGGEVARVTTAGTVTVVPTKEPTSLSTNQDGDIWFLGNYPNDHDPAVVSMTTAGSTTAAYPLDGTAGITEPTVITTSPNGMIWFGDGSAIARLDPSIPPTT